MKTKLVYVVALLILINFQWTQCQRDFENERTRRTIGVFFRSFLNTVQTQRQPAPNVVSFKPSKQSNPPAFTADIVSSSKMQPNLLKTSIPISITKAPTTTIPKMAPTLPPQSLTEPQDITETPLDPIPDPNPPPGHQPLKPLNYEIPFPPFQKHQALDTPFAGFGIHPHPLDYQSEIYLQGHVGRDDKHSGLYSPDNDWHDVEEIFSKGDQTVNVEKEKVENKNEEFGKLKNVELNKYTTNIKTDNDCDSSTGRLLYNNNKCLHNQFDHQRKDGHYQNYDGEEFGGLNYLPPQIFVPYVSHSDLIAKSFGSNLKGLEDNSHSGDKSRSFHKVFDEAFKKLAPEGFSVKLEPLAVQDRPRVSDVGVLQNRTWSENTNLISDDNSLKQNVDSTLNQNSQENYKNLQNNIYYPQQNVFFSEHGLVYLPGSNVPNYNIVHSPKDHIQDVQVHTGNGDPLSGQLEAGNQHYYFQNPPFTYDSHSDYTEFNNLHANGYYHFKRSYKRQV